MGSNTVRVGLILQIRLDSSRLPQKALLPLGPVTMAEAVMHRLKNINADEYILATDAASTEILAPLAVSSGFKIFSGPKEDVLLRFFQAASLFSIDHVIRATGDNPFVSAQLANLLLPLAVDKAADYAGFLGMPIGMGVEFIRFSALSEAMMEATEPLDREHVCPWLYNHPERFNVFQPLCPPEWQLENASLTVDTIEDYSRAKMLVEKLGPNPDDSAIMDYLRKTA